MTETCLQCGDKLRGRLDKKFCSDQCRNAYNNQKNQKDGAYMRYVNGILRKNRKLLEKHAPTGKGKTTFDVLKKEGYDFNYFTNTLITKAGKTYIFCYEFGYLTLTDGWLAVVKKNNEEQN